MTHRNFCTSILSVLFCAFFFITQSGATCYFPDYLQGEYVMQSSMHSSPQVQYSSVSVTEDVISIWGYCQKKIGNDLFLIENISNNSYCSRCFQISVKSKNILIVRTASNPHRCFLNASAAELSCPKTEHFDLNKQLILYKTNKEIKKEHCPFNGNYTLQYKQYKPNYTVECIDSSSYINNCPVGSDLNIYFRDCPFENYEIVYECLGTWNGPNNQKYLALFDTRSEETSRPQYRCGLYTEVSGNSTVYIAFSSDSTCTTDLKNSQSGFETFVLTSQTNAQLQVSEKNCRFPNWLQGHWELVTVDGKLLSYTDTVHFKTYIFYCLTYDESERRYEFPISADEDKKILVRGRSHCSEEEQYTCMWIKRRGPNVFEFQLSTENSFDYDSSLCLTANFKSDIWITQGRKDYLEESPCPVLGEYVGTLPGVENLCAKLSSDCAAPDTMYYTVSDCVEQIYEDKRRRIRQTYSTDEVYNSTLILNNEIKSEATGLNENQTVIPNYVNTIFPAVSSIVITNETKNNESLTAFETTIVTTSLELNDSITEKLSTPKSLNGLNDSTSTEMSNVGSYFVENRNLPNLIFNDGRFDIPAKTFLPAPISSSTMPPPYRRNYGSVSLPEYHNQYPYDNRQYPDYSGYYNQANNYLPHRTSGYFQSHEQNRNPYFHVWNRTRQADFQSGQTYMMDPNAFEKKTIIALPPIQLPPAVLARPVFNVRRNIHLRKFKDREYKCLGQWQENGLTYTFTQRKYTGTYECFVGNVISESKFLIREAGTHCERNKNSLMPGMILEQKSSCIENRTSSTIGSFVPTTQSVPITVTSSKYTSKRLPPPTKSWRPILNTTRPQTPSRNKNSNPNNGVKHNVPSYLLLLFTCIYYEIFC